MFDCCRVLLLTIYVMQPDLVATSAMSNTAASDPQCDTNASEHTEFPEGTFLRLWCNISFSGDLAPVMKWSRNNGEEFEGTITNRSGQMYHTITRELKVEDNGKIYTCLTYFLPMNSTNTTQPSIKRARNEPSYRYQWNFTAVVWFGPINIYVSPNKSIYSINDHLQCHANGTPQPTYAWMTAERVYIASGAYLTIEAKNTPSVIYCVATNDKLSTSMNITINISKEISAQLIAIVIVGSICVTLLILVICMAAVRLKGLEILRPGFQRETMNEPDIVQHADNDGDYVRPEELLMENQCRPIEEEHFEQDNGAACQPCQVAGPGEAALDRYVQPAFPVYGVVRKARKESMRDDKIISMSSVSDEMKQKSDAPSYEADYLDMSGFRMLSSSSENPPKPRSPMFSTSEYASIDHTLILMTPPKLN